MLKVFTPADGETVSLTGDRVRLFYRMYKACGNNPDLEAHPWTNVSRDTDGSHPAPVLLSWNTDAPWDKYDFAVHISESADFSDETVTVIPDEGTAYAMYNLKIGKKYYWYVENRGEFAEKSSVSSFVTADEFPRAIYLDPHNTNIRDAGGLFNIDGRRVRQGLLYRGANIDKDRTPNEEGFARLIGELGVRTDIDLRGNDFTEPPARHPLAEPIKRHIFPLGGYEQTVVDEGHFPVVSSVFRLMCDETIYPAYLHCHSGMDRTGTSMFLLGLALRIDLETLLLDYELSALSEDGWDDRNRRMLLKMLEGLRAFGDEKDDIYDLTEKYFDKALGLPDAPETLRRIFLEE